LRKRAENGDDARLIRDELEALLELEEQNGGKVARARREGRYETAVRWYHEIAKNSDVIEVTRRGLRPKPNIRVLNRSKQSQRRVKPRSVLSVISCSKNACIVRAI